MAERINPASRSYTGLPAVAGEAGGVPIYGYGRVFVYGESPDLAPGAVLQDGNAHPRTKMQLKRTWEIADSKVGSMVSWQPRTPENDIQPYLAINLIDGDPETAWCNRGEGQATVEPAWIRLDLPAEETLTEIVLVPHHKWPYLPKELTIKLSQDAWHWTTVCEAKDVTLPADGAPLRFSLNQPMPVKQIWVIAQDLPLFHPSGIKYGTREYRFILAEVQAVNTAGENVALASRGTGVSVSSTNYTEGSTWDFYDQMWPVQYDLGAGWLRLSGSNPPYDHDTLLWRWVEYEKGKYRFDPRTDQAMAEAVANGCQIIVMLTYANWFYTAHPEYQSFTVRDFPRPFSGAPITRELIEGYKNWVRAMVQHYHGSVAYWEIYNEPTGFGWEAIEDYDERAKAYCDLVKEVVPVIREADPTVKIGLAGMAGVPRVDNLFWKGHRTDWLDLCLEQGVAPLVDAIGWHIQGTVVPELPAYKIYAQKIREFQRDARAAGFKGVWLASEAWWGAPYPTHSEWPHPPHSTAPGLPRITEMRKAKDMARLFMMNIGLDTIPFWCNTWFDQTQNDCGIFRNGFASDPGIPTQPAAAYYALRNLSTVTDSTRPTDLSVKFSTYEEIDCFSFTLPGDNLMVSLWLGGPSVDKHPGLPTDVVIAGVHPKQVIGIDTFNGTEQALDFVQRDGDVVIPRLRVFDYPIALKLIC